MQGRWMCSSIFAPIFYILSRISRLIIFPPYVCEPLPFLRNTHLSFIICCACWYAMVCHIDVACCKQLFQNVHSTWLYVFSCLNMFFLELSLYCHQRPSIRFSHSFLEMVHLHQLQLQSKLLAIHWHWAHTNCCGLLPMYGFQLNCICRKQSPYYIFMVGRSMGQEAQNFMHTQSTVHQRNPPRTITTV